MLDEVENLFAQAAVDGATHLAGKGLRAAGGLAMRGLRRTRLGKYLPTQAKVANERGR